MSFETQSVATRSGTAQLNGPSIEVGATAPDFTVIGNDTKPVTLSSFRGKKVVIVSVPSLDTPTCDLETRRFNQEAANLGADIEILVVSVDLPFAQKRWCGAAGVERVRTLSDHKDLSFGTVFGVVIPAQRLLARAVFIVDRNGKLAYRQLVEPMGNEPDYDAVLNALKLIG